MPAFQGRFRRLVVVVSCAVLLLPAARVLHGAIFPSLTERYPVGDPLTTNPENGNDGPKGLATADMNADGRPDLVIANVDGSVSVLLGSESGAFSDQILTPAAGLLFSASVRSVAVADYTGDAIPDVAAADVNAGVVILAGNGDGTLVPIRLLPFLGARTLDTGDINRDGSPDLLVGTSPTDCEDSCWRSPERSVFCLLGAGGGQFSVPFVLLPAEPGCLHDVALGDMDGDGILDAAALLLNSCESRFDSHPRIALFAGVGNGFFSPAGTVASTGYGTRAFALTWIDEVLEEGAPVSAGSLDLVMANRNSATLDIFRGEGGLRFAAPVTIPAGDSPRSVAAGDLDGDGLADLVVVNRDVDSVSVLRGLGDLAFAAPVESPVGTSPRDLVLDDLTGDGSLDAAIVNRVSADVTILRGREGLAGFLLSDLIQTAGLTPVDVVARDFDGDGVPDVATASVRSHDVRVRLNLGDGSFGSEVVYPVGLGPTCMEAADIDGDGLLDLVVACSGLGYAASTGGPPQAERGAIVTLRGLPGGQFAPPITTEVPRQWSRPFWLRVGDLSEDGVPDLAFSTLAGNVLLFRGEGNGSFATPVPMATVDTGRPTTLTLGDFDRDGRLDIATSHSEIILNDGRLFESGVVHPALPFTVTPPVPGLAVLSWIIDSADLDDDGLLDIMITVTFQRPDPIAVFFGKGDGSFEEPQIYAGPDQGVVDLAAADIDGDGVKDMIVGNRCGANVIVMKGTGNRRFEPLETAQAYRVEGIAVADMNQDARPDIVGVGIGLWILPNGGASHLEPPPPPPAIDPALPGLWINEILSLNRGSYSDSLSQTPDWIELYNKGAVRPLSGWLLRQRTREDVVSDWAFPADATLADGGRLVVFLGSASTEDAAEVRIPHLHADTFRLSQEGETLSLVDPSGVETSRVDFPALPADVSFARTTDGARTFAYQQLPSLGGANWRPGNMDPKVEVDNPLPIADGSRVAIRARAFDDTGIAFAVIGWRRAEEHDFTEEALHDDGQHGDGLAGDGVLGAILPPAPEGTIVKFYARVVDLEGQMTMKPDNPAEESKLFSVRIPSSHEGLRLSEVVADNETGIVDERSQLEDWVEVVNCGPSTIDLAGMALSKSYFDLEDAWYFPGGMVLESGARAVIFCDDDESQGPFHTPFHLDREGDEVYLLYLPPDGLNAPVVLDVFAFGALGPDTAYGRPACGEPETILDAPSPWAPNRVSDVAFVRGEANADGLVDISDAVFVLNYLFSGGTEPPCLDAADFNDSNELNITDPIGLLGFLFTSGPPPAWPWPDCAKDETEDAIHCAASPCK